MHHQLLLALHEHALVCDGAMGTQLMAAGLAGGACGEAWNIERPQAVQAIHEAYRRAGCDLITTNTFGANPLVLARHGRAKEMEDLNRAGAALARAAAGAEAWVLGDVGPCGDFLAPVGEVDAQELFDQLRRQAQALAEGGADALIVETMADPVEMSLAVRAAKEVAHWPVLATYAFARAGGEFRTMTGADVTQAVAAAVQAGADVVGANCGAGLAAQDYVDLGTALTQAAGPGTPVIVQPNAGAPRTVDGRPAYDAGPAEMGQLAARLQAAGVRVVGGCCGTTPQHLRVMAKTVHSTRRAGSAR